MRLNNFSGGKRRVKGNTVPLLAGGEKEEGTIAPPHNTRSGGLI